jgi:hypothetical protein
VLKFLKVILSLAFLFIPVDWWRILHKWLKSLANLTFRFYIGTPALCFLISASISKSFNMNHFYVSYDFYVFIRVGVSCNSLPECVRSCFAYIVGFSPFKHPQSVFFRPKSRKNNSMKAAKRMFAQCMQIECRILRAFAAIFISAEAIDNIDRSCSGPYANFKYLLQWMWGSFCLLFGLHAELCVPDV